MTMRRALLALAMAGCVTQGASTQQQSLESDGPSITGVVSDGATGAPIEGASMSLELGGSVADRATTDVGGSYRFTKVVMGAAYLVRGSAAGYAANAISVATPGVAARVNADLRLFPAHGDVSPSAMVLDFGATATELSLTLTNDTDVSTDFHAITAATWVTLIPAEGTLAARGSTQLTVSVDRSALGAFGVRSTLLTVLGGDGASFVDVRLINVDGNSPELNYDVSVLDFATTQAELSFTVRNVGTGSLEWSVPTHPGYLTFTPSSGTLSAAAEATVTVTLDRTSFAPGAIVDDYVSFESNSVVDTVLPIRAHVETPGVETWSLDHEYLALPSGAVSDVVLLTNTGTLPIDWTTAGDDPWTTAVPARGRLLAGDYVLIYVAVDTRNLSGGGFGTGITFTSTAGDIVLPVYGTRVLVPILETPSRLRFAPPDKNSFTVSTWANNAGEGGISFNVSTSTPWLNLITTSDYTSGGVSCAFLAEGACGTPIYFDIQPASFVEGTTYTGTITVSGAGQSRDIEVTVTADFLPYRWSSLRPSTPVPLQRTLESSIVYDPVRDRVVLYGGGPPQPPPSDLYSTCTNGTWEFDGTQWNEVVTVNQPGACLGFSLAYDRRRGVVVAILPYGDSPTWEYDGVNWTSHGNSVSTDYTSAPVWSPEVNALVTKRAITAEFELMAYRQHDWHIVATGAPSTTGPLIGADSGVWLQTNTGVRYAVDYDADTDTGGFFAVYRKPVDVPIHSVVDPTTLWNFDISSYYEPGRLFAGNLDTGQTIVDVVPADFEKRREHEVVYDSRRRRMVIVGGTACELPCAAYATPMPTAFLDLLQGGLPYSETPVLEVSSSVVDFGTFGVTTTFSITNTGTGALDFAGELPAPFFGKLDYDPVLAGAPRSFQIAVDRGAMSSGSYQIPWTIRSDGGNTTVSLRFVKP